MALERSTSCDRLNKLPPYRMEVLDVGDSNSVAAKISECVRSKRKSSSNKDEAFDLVSSVINNKDFGNPSLLNNITDYFKIDEIGSNYPKPIFNPHEYSKSEDPPLNESIQDESKANELTEERSAAKKSRWG